MDRIRIVRCLLLCHTSHFRIKLHNSYICMLDTVSYVAYKLKDWTEVPDKRRKKYFNDDKFNGHKYWPQWVTNLLHRRIILALLHRKAAGLASSSISKEPRTPLHHNIQTRTQHRIHSKVIPMKDIIPRTTSPTWSTRNNPRPFMSMTTADEGRTTAMQRIVFFWDFVLRVCVAVCLTLKVIELKFSQLKVLVIAECMRVLCAFLAFYSVNSVLNLEAYEQII